MRTIRTPKKRAAFLAELAERGIVTDAAQAIGIGRTAAYQWRADDPDFAAAWDAALEEAADALEREAVRRAMEGSDTLIIFLLKGARPEKYRERHELTGKDGAPLFKVYEKSDDFDPDSA